MQRKIFKEMYSCEKYFHVNIPDFSELEVAHREEEMNEEYNEGKEAEYRKSRKIAETKD